MELNQVSQKEVADYYNDFAKKQVRTGLNLRHYKSFDFIKKNGLRKDHNVLEVGCGIGTFTELLLGYLKKGSILGTDISSTNIEVAKETLSKYKNAEFLVTDMIDFQIDQKFDFIVMLDVLEHIPIEQHMSLFESFSKVLKEDGTIFINIPHHVSLDYVRTYEPERMQIIDQSLSTNLLIDSIYKNDFRIVSLNSYSIFNKVNDYQRIILKPNKVVDTLEPFKQSKIIKNKLYYRLRAFFSNL